MIGSTSLIIDDKKDDGLAVAKTLWSKGYSCFYFEYDIDKSFQDIAKQSGVRIIFQDICLVSENSPTKTDYDAALNTIDNLLEENNGPWLLATWSTWETDHAALLFEHLKENLPDGKKPFSFICLEKGKLSINGVETHSAVKNLNAAEINDLYQLCADKVAEHPSFQAISLWERALSTSAHRTVNSLSSVPMQLSPDTFDKALGSLLHQMAISETGPDFSDDVKSQGVSRVLNNLASNQAYYSAVIDKACLNANAMPEQMSDNEKAEWARRANYILHIETGNYLEPAPGIVYDFKKPNHYYLQNGEMIEHLVSHYSDGSLKDFLLSELNRNSFPSVYGDSKLVLVDVTPPCDHAQKKAQWRKFLIGIEVIVKFEEFTPKFCKQFQTKSRWKGPLFSIETGKNKYDIRFIYTDLRLVMSVPDSAEFIDPLIIRFSLKEQLQRELVATLSSHMARPGIVDLTR